VGNKKLRIINTETDNLVSNLRGEIAEVVTSWILMRHFITSAANLQTDDLRKDLGNPDLAFLYVLRDKLEDELVARLSELAEEKIGCLNFDFAAKKLARFHPEVAEFSKYIEKNGFRQKRNQDISHKELPEKWEDHRAPLHIPYRTIVRAIASALRLMKRIDHIRPNSLDARMFKECCSEKCFRLQRRPRRISQELHRYSLITYCWRDRDARFPPKSGRKGGIWRILDLTPYSGIFSI
jgi:hypothetical protein